MLHSVVILGAGLALASISAVAAEPACKKDEETGEDICDKEPVPTPGGMPKAAQIAIAVICVTVFLLTLILIVFIRRSRRASAEAERDVTIEASQMTGPPAILAATYTPETGHSRVYSIGPDTGGFSAVPVTPANNAPRSPAPPSAAERSGVPSTAAAAPTPSMLEIPRSSTFNRFPSSVSQPPKTAPAHKVTFSDPNYPFTGYGNNSKPPSSPAQQQPPRSAFVSSGGFPRPLLAGRLKDRIRERPPSISSLNPINSPK